MRARAEKLARRIPAVKSGFGRPRILSYVDWVYFREKIPRSVLVSPGLVNWRLFDGPRFKVGHRAILDRIAHLDRVAANLTIFDEDLTGYGCVQHHGDLFPAVWARKKILHRSNRDQGAIRASSYLAAPAPLDPASPGP